MRNKTIFVACDTSNLNQIKNILKKLKIKNLILFQNLDSIFLFKTMGEVF